MMSQIVICVVLMVYLLVIVGCAQLPQYAVPKLRESYDKQVSFEDEFTYRPLKVEDFKAQSLPENLSAHVKSINAHACIRVRPTADSKISVGSEYYQGKRVYFGHITHIAFEATMSPNCSWWNPNIPSERTAYVLQHEQIHFAITEIAARKLTQKARTLIKDFIVIQNSVHEARAEITNKISTITREAMTEALKQHTAFDEDTSLLLNIPKAHRWWLKEVEEQLRKTDSSSKQVPHGRTPIFYNTA